MKMHCTTCGCHFDNDFFETLKPECTLWEQRGFTRDMATEHKRAIWDAYFSVPVDAIADDTGVITDVQIRATPEMTYTVNQFELMVLGYKDWEDQEKRNFQKRYWKFYYNQPADQRMRMQLEAMDGWDDLVSNAANKQMAKIRVVFC